MRDETHQWFSSKNRFDALNFELPFNATVHCQMNVPEKVWGSDVYSECKSLYKVVRSVSQPIKDLYVYLSIQSRCSDWLLDRLTDSEWFACGDSWMGSWNHCCCCSFKFIHGHRRRRSTWNFEDLLEHVSTWGGEAGMIYSVVWWVSE